MKKIFLAVFLFIPITVLAYENEYFSIDINDEYNEAIINDNVYTWTNKTTNDIPNIVITISNNNKNKLQNIKDYTSKDIDNYKLSLENKYNNELSKYNINTSITTIKKKNINNIPSIYYETYYNTLDYYGYDIYQYNYTFTTNNYITSITYTTNKNENKLESFINTFKIKDSIIKDKSFFEYKKNKILILLLSIGLLILLIFELLLRKTKKSKKAN